MQVDNKSKLRPGDVIWFYNYGIGGFLFGIVIEDEDKNLTVWRPKCMYSIDSIHAVELIESVDDVENYALHDFQEIMEEARKKEICFNNLPDDVLSLEME